MTELVHKLDTVVLLHDIPDAGLRAGDLGAVVHVYTPDVFEVEFVDSRGDTLTLQTLAAADVRLAHDDEGPRL